MSQDDHARPTDRKREVEVDQAVSAAEGREQISARYQALVTLWSHRDATMHQWPLLIMTATGALLALIFSQNDLENLLQPARWGLKGDVRVWLGMGIPLLISGFAMMPFIYGMARAIIIMDDMEQEITRIETSYLGCRTEQSFAFLHHPGGWSSRQLILRTISGISFALVFAGSTFALGILLGSLLFVIILTLAVMCRYSHRFVNVRR